MQSTGRSMIKLAATLSPIFSASAASPDLHIEQVGQCSVIVCAGAVGAPADACIDTVTVRNPDNAVSDTELTFAVSLAQQSVVVKAPADDLSKLPDQKLRKRTDSVLALADQLHHDGVLISGEFRTAEYESCLTEIIRRGGERWERYLRERLEDLDAKVIRQGEAGDSSTPGAHRNLELLTALRRVQGRRDPLTILTIADAPLTITLPELPLLKVRIQNVDVQEHNVGFTFGGNYRSGRQARWKVVLTGADGKVVPRRGRYGFGIAGGLYTEGTLAHGESWETSLDLRKFMDTPAPGTYDLRILYHNTECIADVEPISNRIVSRSKAIRVIVKPLPVRLSKRERVTIEKLVAGLRDRRPLKILAGTYGESAHDFISPEAPEGKILLSGTKAIPVLLDALTATDTTAEQRAWVFAILFSLTGDNDPQCCEGAVGSHMRQESGWQLRFGRPGENPSFGMGWSEDFSSNGGRIDPKAQSELIKKWQGWRGNLRVISD